MHEEPRVPNFVSAELLANDIVLAEGMVLAVEPMVNSGTSHLSADGFSNASGNEWQEITASRAFDRAMPSAI